MLLRFLKEYLELKILEIKADRITTEVLMDNPKMEWKDAVAMSIGLLISDTGCTEAVAAREIKSHLVTKMAKETPRYRELQRRQTESTRRQEQQIRDFYAQKSGDR